MSASALNLSTYPVISIILPVFNQEELVGTTIKKLAQLCKAQELEYEIIVIDNGSVDNTATLLKLLAADLPGLRVHSITRRISRGAAIREGMYRAVGEYVLLCGVKETLEILLENPDESLSRALDLLKKGYDVVITEPRGGEAIRGWGAGLLSRLKKGLPSFWEKRAEAPLIFFLREKGCELTQEIDTISKGEIHILSLARERKHRIAELVHPQVA